MIGFFSAAALLKKGELRETAMLNLYLAALSVIVSGITGLTAASGVTHDEQVHQIMETHETLEYVILAIIPFLPYRAYYREVIFLII